MLPGRGARKNASNVKYLTSFTSNVVAKCHEYKMLICGLIIRLSLIIKRKLVRDYFCPLSKHTREL